MNETWPFRAGANDMELAQNITGAKLREAGVSRKRRCNGMSETWCLHRGEGYGVCIDDVTRLVCIFSLLSAEKR